MERQNEAHYDDGTALRPQYPRHQAVGVIHMSDGWFVYWDGQISDRAFPNRTAAIDELAARDRAERFVEQEA